jgi:hypothetical protein
MAQEMVVLKKTIIQSLGNKISDWKAEEKWEDEVRRHASRLLNTKNWRAAARHRSD